MTIPEVSVVVVVRDDPEGVTRLLDALDRQTLDASRFEVVVVANGCRDGRTAAAARGRARLVEEARPGRARARNLGFRVAAAQRVAFVDADCVPAATWLEALLACGGEHPLVAGRVDVTAGPRPGPVERLEQRWRFAQEAWVGDGWAATANLLVDRRAFDAIGGFDEAYIYSEDADLCIRAGRAGFSLGYCDAAAVAHPPERELRPFLVRLFWHGYGSAQAMGRIGVGERAWRHPRPLVSGGTALSRLGFDERELDPVERRRLSRVARAGHAARVAGSLYRAVAALLGR